MTLIDRDELLKHEVMIITKGNAAFHGVPSSLIETAPVIDLKNLQPVWRDPETDPPKVEEDVLILFETACGGYGITNGSLRRWNAIIPMIAFFTGMNLQHGASWMKNMMITSSPKGGGNIVISTRMTFTITV